MNESKSDTLKKIITIVILCMMACVTALCSIRKLPARIETYGEDALYRKLDGISENIRIIAIDERTLDQLGPYSDWNRGYFADLLNLLNAPGSKPAVIGLDVMFTSTNNSEADQALVDAVAACGNVVLASSWEAEEELIETDGRYYTRTYISNESKPYEALAAVAEYGFTNTISDSDGIVRRAYVQLPPDYQSFSYRIASKISALPRYNNLEEIRYSVKPGEIEAISMADVLDGTVPASYFEGSIVLIGAYATGLMDSYKVPCDYSRQMYGVEMQASFISAFLHNKICSDVSRPCAFILLFLLTVTFSAMILKWPVRKGLGLLAAMMVLYPLLCFGIFWVFSKKMPLVAPMAGMVLIFICGLLYKYVEVLKRRQQDTQQMLFSMAEAFAEAIEGRSPYNANHTKNVARRCMEMVDHINTLYKENRSEYSFTEKDKRQLYLAAMLHDVGKLDIPLEIMDKPTKLGGREEKICDRLQIILLKLEKDILSGRLDREKGEQQIAEIRKFLENLDVFNCGRPLNDDEQKLLASMEKNFYEEENGKRILYLTPEESEDLHIKTGTLSDQERKLMQSHVKFTDKILSHMSFGEEYRDVRHMAADHHEMLNGSGYPKQLKDGDIDIMTRILTVMDIYDSLIADDRPYKKPKSVKAAFEILDEEAAKGKIDPQILAYAKELYLNE